MRLLSASLALILMLGVTPTFAGESYFLRKDYDTFSSSTYRQIIKLNLVGVIIYKTDTGESVQGSVETVYDETLDISPQNKSKKIIHFVSACSNVFIRIGEKTEVERECNALNDRNVIAEKQSGIWKYRLTNGEPTLEQKKELSRLEGAYDEEDVYPSTPASVGDTFEIPPDVMANITGMWGSSVDGSASVRLHDITDYKNTQSALLIHTYNIEMDMFEDGALTEITMDGTGREYRRLSDNISLYSEHSGLMRLSSRVVEAGVGMTVNIRGKFTMQITESLGY